MNLGRGREADKNEILICEKNKDKHEFVNL